MVAVQGAALKMMTVDGDSALARAERTARARLAAPVTPQASPALLRVATLLAAAAVNLHAVAPAWRAAAGLPAVAPR